MTMKTVSAKIRWLSQEEGGRRTPFCGERYLTVVHFAEDPGWPDETWSLVVNFSNPKGLPNPTDAEVHFLVEEAPRELLRAGNQFELTEGARTVARGTIVERQQTCAVTSATDQSVFSPPP